MFVKLFINDFWVMIFVIGESGILFFLKLYPLIVDLKHKNELYLDVYFIKPLFNDLHLLLI